MSTQTKKRKSSTPLSLPQLPPTPNKYKKLAKSLIGKISAVENTDEFVNIMGDEIYKACNDYLVESGVLMIQMVQEEKKDQLSALESKNSILTAENIVNEFMVKILTTVNHNLEIKMAHYNLFAKKICELKSNMDKWAQETQIIAGKTMEALKTLQEEKAQLLVRDAYFKAINEIFAMRDQQLIDYATKLQKENAKLKLQMKCIKDAINC